MNFHFAHILSELLSSWWFRRVASVRLDLSAELIEDESREGGACVWDGGYSISSRSFRVWRKGPFATPEISAQVSARVGRSGQLTLRRNDDRTVQSVAVRPDQARVEAMFSPTAVLLELLMERRG